MILKCPRCRLKGQRKGYLNYGLKEHENIKKLEVHNGQN